MEILKEEVLKSQNDTNFYRVIRLKNGLKALLISEGLPSDDDKGLAAAALCVGVGSFSDPDEVPGLAHFVEHMVFLGSRKYPEENHFDKLIKGYGGSFNANTDLETTVFFFDIQHDQFKVALDRFMELLVHPMLDKDSMERELLLVHAEWAMSTQDENERFAQLLGTMAKPGHPMGKFSWGNAASLKTTPQSNGIDVHQRLVDFHRKYYLAQYMTLAIVAKESLDTLQSWVLDLFDTMPYSDLPRPDFSHVGPPFETPRFHKVYRIIPAKCIRQIQLCWALPSLLHEYRKQPLHYMAFLLGYEGEGSLISLLQKRKWATSVQCGNDETGQEHNSTWACFNICLKITETGLQQFVEVITVIFQYLNMLKAEGPQERIWQEMHHIASNEFKWFEMPNYQDFVRSLAIDMQKYRPCDYITGSRMVLEYDAQLITNCLHSMMPHQMNIALWSNSFKKESCANWHIEPWFQTSYCVEEIPDDWEQRWSECGSIPEFFFPKENIFIATNFDLKSSDILIKTLDNPISESSMTKIWYKSNTEYAVPKAFINLYLKNLEAVRSAANQCLRDLYVVALQHIVNKDAYPGHVANLRGLSICQVAWYSKHGLTLLSFFIVETRCRIKVFDEGFTIHCHGFSDKLPSFFEKVIESISTFDLHEELFDTVHEELSNLYDNSAQCPEKLNKELTKALLQPRHFDMLQKKECLTKVTWQLVAQFSKLFYKGMSVEGIFFGNVTPQEVIYMEEFLVQHLKVIPVEEIVDVHQILVTKLPAGSSAYTIMNQNKNDENSVITNYYQIGESDLRQQLLNELFITHMEEPLFNKLRTKLQLGYEVLAKQSNIHGVIGFKITVCSQASRFSMENLDQSIETFLDSYNQEIQKMNIATFEKLVENAINAREVSSLESETEGHWLEILQQTYCFNRQTEEAKELKTLTLDELKVWAQNILCHNTSRAKLSIQVKGHSRVADKSRKQIVARRNTSTSAIDYPYHEITSLQEFKSKCENYTIRIYN